MINALALYTCSKAVDALSKSGKRLSCDFAIVIKEWETMSSCYYVPSNHFLCGNYGNTLITSTTRRASDLMNALNPLRIALVHALKFTAGTPMAIIPGLSHHGTDSSARNMPRSYLFSSDKDGMLLKLQVHGQQSFVESIGGEESPATSFNRCRFSAILSGETNGRQRPLVQIGRAHV